MDSWAVRDCGLTGACGQGGGAVRPLVAGAGVAGRGDGRGVEQALAARAPQPAAARQLAVAGPRAGEGRAPRCRQRQALRPSCRPHARSEHP